MTKDELLEEAKRLRYTLTQAQGILSDLLREIAAADLPSGPRPACSRCGVSFRNQRLVDEHVYNSHGGPVPPHILAAEARAE